MALLCFLVYCIIWTIILLSIMFPICHCFRPYSKLNIFKYIKIVPSNYESNSCNILFSTKTPDIMETIVTSSSSSSSLTSNVETINPAIEKIKDFEKAWNSSLYGNFTAMKKLLLSDATWDNPFFSKASEFYDSMTSFSQFFLEPSLLIFNSTFIDNSYVIDYQLSFTYPLPWRPRVIIPGRAKLIFTFNSQIEKVYEKWEVSVIDIMTKQVLPRWWDVWHVFSSPSPEHPPMKMINKVNGVTFYRCPSSITCDVEWTGLAKYPGPPISVIPAFSLFGELKTSKPNRDRFFTVLPVDVRSGKYSDINTGQTMKRSTWSFHVPSYLQHLLIQQVRDSEYVSKPIIYNDISMIGVENIDTDDMEDVEGIESIENSSSSSQKDNNYNNHDDEKNEGPSIKADFVEDMETTKESVSKRVTKLYDRGKNVTFDKEIMSDFEQYERKMYRYRLHPAKLIASVDLFGETNSEKISEAIRNIQTVVKSNSQRIITGKSVRIQNDGSSKSDLGLQLYYTKVCFNPMAQPAMAIYEIQYNSRRTRVYLELDIQ